MKIQIRHVFQLDVEEEGDFIFTPAGIVIVLENNRFTLYCSSPKHNLLRSVLSRFPWKDFLYGVKFRQMEFRLQDLTQEMAQHGWTEASSVPAILRHTYSANSRNFYFLQKYVDG